MSVENEIKIRNFDVLIPFRKNSRLRWKEFQILSLLVNRSPELVSRSEIIEHIWKGTYCSDSTINQTIKSIRHKIGDTEHTLIRTIPRLGYKVDNKAIFHFISEEGAAAAAKFIYQEGDIEEVNSDLPEGELNEVIRMEGEIIEDKTTSESGSPINSISSETATTPWRRIVKYLAAFISLLTVSLLSYALGSRTKPATQHELPTSPRMVWSFSLDAPPSTNPQTLSCVYLEGSEKEMRVECSTR